MILWFYYFFKKKGCMGKS